MKAFTQKLLDKVEVADDVSLEQLKSTPQKTPALTPLQLEHFGYGAEHLRKTIKRVDQIVEEH